MIKVFVVDSDPVYIKFLKKALNFNSFYEVELFKNGNDCLAKLYKLPQIIILNYSLPDFRGEEILKQIKSINSNIHVIIISNQKNITTAVNLMKQGAYDYITKDTKTKKHLLHSLKGINLVKDISTKYDLNSSIIGSSSAIKKTNYLLNKAIKTNINVFITGEIGTGKKLAARVIHNNSNRKKENFCTVNIAAIPKDLLESELFGYKKETTETITEKTGKIEKANNGTLFLSEIGEMNMNSQTKLLHILKKKALAQVKEKEVAEISPRIIASTHKNLAQEVSDGNFREDLYSMLLGLSIEMPPLRDRENDIIIIANKLLTDFCAENDLSCNIISKEAKEKLLNYPFPGNVRELKSVIELAAVMGSGKEIKAEDIFFKAIKEDSKIIFKELTLKEYESKIINHFMNKYNNNVLKVARVLNIGKSTIYRHLKKKKPN